MAICTLCMLHFTRNYKEIIKIPLKEIDVCNNNSVSTSLYYMDANNYYKIESFDKSYYKSKTLYSFFVPHSVCNLLYRYRSISGNRRVTQTV